MSKIKKVQMRISNKSWKKEHQLYYEQYYDQFIPNGGCEVGVIWGRSILLN